MYQYKYILNVLNTLYLLTFYSFFQLLFNYFLYTFAPKAPELLSHQHCVCSHRNPPPDHWALISGLPTYVAESGYVSL